MTFTTTDDHVHALSYYEESLEHYQALGDRFHMAWLLYYTGLSRAKVGVPDDDALSQSLEIRRALDDRIGIAYSLHELVLQPHLIK